MINSSNILYIGGSSQEELLRWFMPDITLNRCFLLIGYLKALQMVSSKTVY